MDEYSSNATSPNDGIEQHQGIHSDMPYAQPHVPTPGPAPESATDSAGNIDKIRDIIFGSHIRDYDQRFARLEESLRKESLDIRDATRKHLEALEAFVHKELSAIDARLNAERDERTEHHSRLSADLASHASSVFKKIGEVENQEAQAKREIRSDLLQQSKELTDAIRGKSEELMALLERRAQELQHAKTDRSALASLFSEVSLRLTDQFKVTGAD
jgi:hypothetical protein